MVQLLKTHRRFSKIRRHSALPKLANSTSHHTTRTTTENILKSIIELSLKETCHKSAISGHVIPGYLGAMCSVASRVERATKGYLLRFKPFPGISSVVGTPPMSLRVAYRRVLRLIAYGWFEIPSNSTVWNGKASPKMRPGSLKRSPTITLRGLVREVEMSATGPQWRG